MAKRFKLSENKKSLLKGIGSSFAICMPLERLENSSSFLNGFNKRLKKIHKNDPFYREYDYRNPATIADCWQDTGKFLSWAMNQHDNKQNKEDIKG